MKQTEEKEMKDSLAETTSNATQAQKAITPTDMYANSVNAGTEEITQEDLNTPVLKIVQASTQDLKDKKEGYLHRSDTNEQLETVDVTLCYVTTLEQENYNKTGMEKVKVYYGFYADTNEPFKLYIRGWSMPGHRDFQSEVGMWKNKMNVPMFALKVRLSTQIQAGTTKDGAKYSIYKLIFTVLKDENGKPEVEMNPARISFLFEAVQRYKELALVTSENDASQNDMPFS